MFVPHHEGRYPDIWTKITTKCIKKAQHLYKNVDKKAVNKVLKYSLYNSL